MTKSEKSPALLAPEWLSLAEAVERLGKSPSTLERWVAAGVIQSKLEPRPGRKPERLYRAADLDHVMRGETVPAGRALTVKKLTPPALLSREGANAPGAPAPQERVSVTAKLWLTLAEAQAYSGFGEAYLYGLMKEGKIVGVKGGPKGSWVIGRKSLEEYGGG